MWCGFRGTIKSCCGEFAAYIVRRRANGGRRSLVRLARSFAKRPRRPGQGGGAAIRVEPSSGISSVDVLIPTERHPACRQRKKHKRLQP